MPFRKLPVTDGGRYEAIRVCYNKNASTPKEQIVISEELQTKVNLFYPKLKKEVDERGEALSSQSAATTARYEAEAKCRMYVSHFFQVFNLGVAREIYKASDRAFYQIDVTSESVPVLSGEENLCKYAEAIISGDALRVAAGGAPMVNPTCAEVEAVYNSFNAKAKDQSSKKDNYEKEQKDVDALRAEADELIRDIWDEIEFKFRKDEPSAMRRKAREYGVVYVSRPGEPEDVDPNAPPPTDAPTNTTPAK